MFYRGFKYSNEIQDVMVTDKDRKPRNLDIEIHKIADDYFLEKFGKRFRSQSVFCTGNLTEAGMYGIVKRIEPIGNFTICWSSKVLDFVDIEFHISENIEESVKKYIDENEYKLDDIESAIASNNEIMLYCDSYKVINLE